MKLNLGCGRDKKEGYIGLDISTEVGADIVCNIECGIPLRDNEVDEILAYNVLEQVSTPHSFVFVMNELWRILKDTGEIIVRVPNANNICAWQDPMDCRRFTEESFTYMQHNHLRWRQYGNHYGFKPWKVERIQNDGIQVSPYILIFKLTPFK